MPFIKNKVAKPKRISADASKRLILRALAFSGDFKSLAILEKQLKKGPGNKVIPVKAHVLKRP